MIKKTQKQILSCHHSEEGSALILSLGIVVLLFVVIASIFFFALETQKNIVMADRYTTLKDAKSYALEEAKMRLTDQLDQGMSKVINGVANPADNGLVTTKINQMLSRLSTVDARGAITKSFFSSAAFGVDKQYQFKVGIRNQVDVKGTAVYGSEASGGWSATPVANQTAKRITIPITIELSEKKSTGTMTHQASSRLVYEVQWEDFQTTSKPFKGALETGKLDSWRNIFYNHYTNGENGQISADTVARLLYRGYKYQANNYKLFDSIGYDTAHPLAVFGGKPGRVRDIKLTPSSTVLPPLSPLDKNTKKLSQTRPELKMTGSFILQDVGLKGFGGGLAQVDASNMIVITGNKTQDATQFIQVSMVGETGAIISRQNQRTIFTSDAELTAPAMLINQTRKSPNSSETGLLIDGSTLSLLDGHYPTPYLDYGKASRLANPQKNAQWADMKKGGLIIAGSVVELRGDKVGGAGIYLSGERRFMLTNATIKEDAKGEESFGYQMVHPTTGAVIPNPPSILKIGGQTQLRQENTGFSFIDAPKKNRRASSSENGSQAQGEWLDSSVSRNLIDIASGGAVNLGVTGIEPFDLKLAKDGVFSFYAPSDPNLLDTTFLKEGVIKGKVIIYLWHEDFDVKAHLASNGITAKVKTSSADAKNGEVTIVKDTASRDARSRNILRTFGYLVDVDFMKKK